MMSITTELSPDIEVSNPNSPGLTRKVSCKRGSNGLKSPPCAKARRKRMG